MKGGTATGLAARPRTPWAMAVALAISLGSTLIPAATAPEPVVHIHSETLVRTENIVQVRPVVDGERLAR